MLTGESAAEKLEGGFLPKESTGLAPGEFINTDGAVTRGFCEALFGDPADGSPKGTFVGLSSDGTANNGPLVLPEGLGSAR